MLKTIVLGLASASLLFACSKEAVGPQPAENAPNLRALTAAETKTLASANDFAFRAFAKVRAAEPAANVFISPLSISSALTVAYSGADGSTKEAMRQTLGFEPMTDDEIGQAYKGLTELLQGIDKRVTFTSANAIWHAQQVQLQAPFVQFNSRYLGAAVQGVDFASPAAKTAINGWVEQKTNGKIKELVDETRPDHVLFLVNAIYFKGAWAHAFDKSRTYRSSFRHDDGSTSPADYMLLPKGQYRYFSDASKQLIDLPYGNGQYSMTVLVPKGQQTLQDLTRDLTRANLNAWLAGAASTDLELHLPKFKFEYKKKLNETLQQLGMAEAFTRQANFSRMLASEQHLFISEVLHKSYVEVDEEGTEATAATSVGVNVTSVPPSHRVDRPFMFLIREKSSDAILFIGQVTQP